MNETNNTSRKWENFADAYENSFEIYNKIVFELMIPLIKFDSSQILLDSGCGSGICIELLQKLHKNFQAYGNDFSKSMINKARSKNLQNTEFIVANCLNLPYPCSFFDRYIANFSLHTVSDQGKMISEAVRVLNNNGRAGFSYPTLNENTDILKILHKALRNIKIGPKGINIFKSIDIIIDTGFKNVHYFDTNIGLDLENGQQAADFIKPLKEVAKLKGSTKYDIVLDYVSTKAQNYLNEGKCLTLGARIVIADKI